MKNKTFYTRNHFNESGEIINTEYLDNKEEQNIFFIHFDKCPFMFKQISNSFERITKIIINNSLPNEEIIEGPELKNKNSSNIKNLLKGATNAKIWTDKTGLYSINDVNRIFFDDLSPSRVPINLSIEKEDNNIKIKKVFYQYRPNKKEVKKIKLFSEIVFDLENNKQIFFPEQRINTKYVTKLETKHPEKLFYNDIPKNILEDFYKDFKEEKEKSIGKEIDFVPKSLDDVFIMNQCPEFPRYITFKEFFGRLDVHQDNKEEVYKQIANILKLECNEEFINNINNDFYATVISAKAKEAGIKNYKSVFNIFKNIDNINESLEGLRYSCINTTIDFFENFRKTIESTLKYRTEEEVINGLSQIKQLVPSTFYTIEELIAHNAYDGKVFDRMSYNYFNEFASTLIWPILKEKISGIVKEASKNATIPAEEMPSGLIINKITNEEDIKNILDYAKSESTYITENLKPENTLSVSILEMSEGNYKFLIVDKTKRRPGEYTPNTNTEVIGKKYYDDYWAYYDKLLEDIPKNTDVEELDLDDPFI